MNGRTQSEHPFPPYQRWYRFGWHSPEILAARLRNKHRPSLWLRRSYQRARYGIADSDAWSLDYFLAKVTVLGVQKLRLWAHGHPGELTPEEWDWTLAQIEQGFQAWLDCDGWFTDPAEEAKFRTGIRLYGQWFGALWD